MTKEEFFKQKLSEKNFSTITDQGKKEKFVCLYVFFPEDKSPSSVEEALDLSECLHGSNGKTIERL